LFAQLRACSGQPAENQTPRFRSQKKIYSPSTLSTQRSNDPLERSLASANKLLAENNMVPSEGRT